VNKPIILMGDSLAALKDMDDNIFDLVLLDPPYFDYRTNHRKDKSDKLSQSLVQQSKDDQLETVRECIKKLKPGSAFFFFTNWQESYWFQSAFHSFLRNEIIWDKGNWAAGDLAGSLANKYEVVFLGTKGTGWNYNGARIHDIWEIPRMGTDRIHSTEKPVELYRRCIEIATQPGALIFDGYVGSGSSAEAAYLTGRNFLGYEVDQEYWERATKRINSL
jgi:site-specific DNA-methyltransferase (adenine-specific)